jgi:GTP-binding protein YchF
MSLQIGIVGLPNVGKSTLFNALTNAGAAVAAYPFTTIEPNVGVVELPDPRLDDIARIVGPQKIIPTAIQFVDIAGLVKDAHKGEGLGNQFLGHIRTVDAVAMVLRCFQNPDVAHVSAELDPLDDLSVVDLELVLADLAVLERRIDKVQSAAKAQPREHAAELDFLARLRAHLETGHQVREMERSPREAGFLQPIGLVTDKPRLLVANVSEDELPGGGPLAAQVMAHAQAEGSEAVVLCAACEADLAEWEPEEAAEYRAELGLEEPGLYRLVRAGYRLLDLITFFTATGGEVLRAWTLQRETPVLEAAGKIHSDMQRGFIRAEVVGYENLMAAGTLSAARERGLLHVEGRDYVVQDGDIVHIRFNV